MCCDVSHWLQFLLLSHCDYYSVVVFYVLCCVSLTGINVWPQSELSWGCTNLGINFALLSQKGTKCLTVYLSFLGMCDCVDSSWGAWKTPCFSFPWHALIWDKNRYSESQAWPWYWSFCLPVSWNCFSYFWWAYQQCSVITSGPVLRNFSWQA